MIVEPVGIGRFVRRLIVVPRILYSHDGDEGLWSDDISRQKWSKRGEVDEQEKLVFNVRLISDDR